MTHLSQLWGASLMIGTIFALLFGISSSAFVLGFTRYNDCPYQPLLPQGLVTFGVIGVLCSILFLIFMVVSFFKVDDSGNHLWYLLYTFAVLVIYGTSVILLTFVIVFGRRTQHSEHQSNNPTYPKSFCHASISNFCHIFALTVFKLAAMFFLWLMRYFININYVFRQRKLKSFETQRESVPTRESRISRK